MMDEFEKQAKANDGPPAENVFDPTSAILESHEFHSLELPKKRSLIHPIIKEQEIGLMTGYRGIGKSWCCMGIADALTRGRNLGPWRVEEPAPCLYLDGEMACVDTQSRFSILNPNNERQAPLYIYSDAYANGLGIPRANLLDQTWRESMCRFLMDKKIKLFLADNLASLTSGIDENTKKEWDPVNSWLIELRFKGISTLSLHHTNKEGGQRGTSAREDNIDISILLKQPANYRSEDGADFIITFTKTRLPLEDLKYIQDYRFTLGKDENGCTAWTWAPVKTETQHNVLRMLKMGVPQKDIAAALGLSPGRISQIKAEAIVEGVIPVDKNKKRGA